MKRTFYPMPELVEAVKAHATEHYEDGGWDVIVECWDDAMIESELRGGRGTGRSRARTPQGAIHRMKRDVVSIYSDRQADAQNSAF